MPQITLSIQVPELLKGDLMGGVAGWKVAKETRLRVQQDQCLPAEDIRILEIFEKNASKHRTQGQGPGMPVPEDWHWVVYCSPDHNTGAGNTAEEKQNSPFLQS